MTRSDSIMQIPKIMHKLYMCVDELESHFPERKFTLDGHLVGSIGEVVAAYLYDLKLLPASHEGHDAEATRGTLVQIKATQGTSISLRANPQHLLVLKLGRSIAPEQVYNGPGELVWAKCGSLQRNGTRTIRLTTLEKLQSAVNPSLEITRVREWPDERIVA